MLSCSIFHCLVKAVRCCPPLEKVPQAVEVYVHLPNTDPRSSNKERIKWKSLENKKKYSKRVPYAQAAFEPVTTDLHKFIHYTVNCTFLTL